LETFSIGLFIRRYLLERDRAYPYEVFMALRKSLLAQGYAKRGSYQNVRNYFRWLRELGLIKEDGTAPSLNPHLSTRRYYTLTSKGLATSPEAIEWTNPRRALYPQSWNRHHKKGEQRTRHHALKSKNKLP
jgi:DNA-binding PadR family transcriptional regulator